MKIPEGWPTAEMVKAARDTPHGGYSHPFMYWKQVVLNVLAAAPTPPASTAWPRECEELCKAAEQFQHAVNELCKAENPDDLQNGDTAMSEEEARELHRERWKGLESAVYYMRKRMSAPPATTPPAQEDEPYAYAYERTDLPKEMRAFYGQAIHLKQIEVIPANWTEKRLYTRPDGLRKAAEELINTFDRVKCLESRYGPCPVIESLRAALEGK